MGTSENRQRQLQYGEDIKKGNLKHGDGPPELLKLYQKWLNAIFEIQWPGYYAKHVAIYFIYKGVRYEMDRHEFDDHVVKDGREGPRLSAYGWKVDGGRFEALLDTVVYDDLIQLGIPKSDILQTGSLD
jgi:hypothetical protein